MGGKPFFLAESKTRKQQKKNQKTQKTKNKIK